MLKTILVVSLLILNACATAQKESRQISSGDQMDPNSFPRVDWQFVSTEFVTNGLVYTPFFINGQELTMYSGGHGADPKNGVLKLTTKLNGASGLSEKVVIKNGPDLQNYNYFRAPRVAKNGSELWMLVEVSGCYTGCDSPSYPKSLAVYRSTNDGQDWTFLDYAKVDGKRYESKWFAHTGLIYNPQGSSQLDLGDLTKNRFITIGENKDIFVSADGLNYKSIPMNHPFAKDRLVFASIAKTPFGFHLTTCANWSDKYYTTTVRHLFSKDLINWYPIESNSYLKNPVFYKGIHLSYDEKSQKLWAISPCGTSEKCGFLAWSEPKDYLDIVGSQPQSDTVPVGEFVYINGKTAMIIEKISKQNKDTYKVRFSNGTYESGYTKDKFVFPLVNYKRQGCIGSDESKLCVGDTVYVNGGLATIIGYNASNQDLIKYAIKFANGDVDTGYTRPMLTLP